MAKRATRSSIDPALLDQLLAGQDPATVLSSQELMGELKKALAERMLQAEMDVHLGSEGEQASGNHRNGTSEKTVLFEDGALTLSIPRDQHGRFDSALIAKYKRRFPGFDEKIIALYARGMSTRDIQKHVGELYGISISPDLVSAAICPEKLFLRSTPLSAFRPQGSAWRATRTGLPFTVHTTISAASAGWHIFR